MKTKNFFSKLFVTMNIFVLLLSIFMLAGCSKAIKVDTSKSQLHLLIFAGGDGIKWLENAKEIFEERYADVSLEEGKVGVQVWIDDGKGGNYESTNCVDALHLGENDICFTAINYPYAISKNTLMDITDLVKEKYDSVDFDGDGTPELVSIEDKMNSTNKNFFNFDGKYYGLPYMSYLDGITYDIDLFEEKGFYILSNGNYSTPDAFENHIYNGRGELSAGLDGIKGTYDDGLPSTWNEMRDLINHIRESGVIPFIWDNVNVYQRTNLFNAIWASYEGENNYNLNYSMDGTYVGTPITYNGEQFTEKEIHDYNGYLISSQNGKLAAITAIKDMTAYATTSSNPGTYYNSTNSHTDAQTRYLKSNTKYRTTGLNYPIAMIIESSYWVNEAKQTFTDMVDLLGEEYSSLNRRFGYMPIPSFQNMEDENITNQINTTLTLSANCPYSAFINNYSNNKEVAKEFFKFIYSNEILSMSTGITGNYRGVKTILSESDMKKMSFYQLQCYDLLNNNVLVNRSTPGDTRFSTLNQSFMNGWYDTIIDPVQGKLPNLFDYFISNPNVSPKTLFDYYSNINESIWGIKEND